VVLSVRRREVRLGRRVDVIPITPEDAFAEIVNSGRVYGDSVSRLSGPLSNYDVRKWRYFVIDAIKCNVSEDLREYTRCLFPKHLLGKNFVGHCLAIHGFADEYLPRLNRTSRAFRFWAESFHRMSLPRKKTIRPGGRK
jgi:hypothetical protein